MKAKIIALLATCLATPALADGFSATLDVPVAPTFSIAGSLNYTVTVLPQLVVGASLSPSITPAYKDSFGLNGRFGAVFVNRFDLTSTLYTDLYAGAAIDAILVPKTSFFGDVYLGAYFNQQLSFGAVYGDVKFGTLINNAVTFYLLTEANLKVNLAKNFDLYTGISFGILPNFVYSLRLGLSYAITEQFKVGIVSSYGRFGNSDSFGLVLTAQFTQKPETLGTPGNYLP